MIPSVHINSSDKKCVATSWCMTVRICMSTAVHHTGTHKQRQRIIRIRMNCFVIQTFSGNPGSSDVNLMIVYFLPDVHGKNSVPHHQKTVLAHRNGYSHWIVVANKNIDVPASPHAWVHGTSNHAARLPQQLHGVLAVVSHIELGDRFLTPLRNYTFGCFLLV